MDRLTEPKRARRRRDSARMVARARRLLSSHFGGFGGEFLDQVASLRADNFSVCSCGMCGNPRRRGHVTMQERRAPTVR